MDIITNDVDVALNTSLQHALHGELSEAEKILRSLPQDDLRVLFNLGWYDLYNDKFEEGFMGLDNGRWIGVFGNDPIPGGQIYHGENLNGAIIMLRLEGGIGDQLCAFRFAHTLTRRGARVIISCTNELGAFLSNQGYPCVSEDGAEHVYFDYWIPGMSAPRLLGYDHSTLSGVPYLKIPNGRKLPEPKSGTLKVGLRWSGNPEFEHEQFRKFPYQLMLDLVPIEGVTFYSFQRDSDIVENLPFIDLINDMETIEDTASLLSQLDLLITSDTSVAHIAAGMGVEVWNIIPLLPYYIYALPGDRTPWYDTMKLYRQSNYNTWTDVFDRIQLDLHKKLKEQ